MIKRDKRANKAIDWIELLHSSRQLDAANSGDVSIVISPIDSLEVLYCTLAIKLKTLYIFFLSSSIERSMLL